MLTKVLPGKFIARVHEGDVRDDEIGVIPEHLEILGISSFERVVLSKISEMTPYFLRPQYLTVILEKTVHFSYEKALKGFVILSGMEMERLDIKEKEKVILDPMTPRFPPEELFGKARKFFQEYEWV